jgi:putative ABC transport system permease protein
MNFPILGDVLEAVNNLRAQKPRSLLTAMGIVFGVGSVIGMLAIGAGAREQSLQFIEQLGVRNVLVDSKPATNDQELQQRRRVSPGLTERDVRILQANIDGLELISARRSLFPARVVPKPSGPNPSLIGVRSSYAAIHNLHLVEGRFLTEEDDINTSAVCVLGQAAKVSLLGYGPATGKYGKVNVRHLPGHEGFAHRSDCRAALRVGASV